MSLLYVCSIQFRKTLSSSSSSVPQNFIHFSTWWTPSLTPIRPRSPVFSEYPVDASQLQLCCRVIIFLFTGGCIFIFAHLTRVAPILRYLRASTCFRDIGSWFCQIFYYLRLFPCWKSTSQETLFPPLFVLLYCSCKLLRIVDIYPQSFSGGFVTKARKRCKTSQSLNLKDKCL